jgi:hypothetical protein
VGKVNSSLSWSYLLWLELTATEIRELFAGRVAEFLAYETPIVWEPLQVQLDQQFPDFTLAEQSVIRQLAMSGDPINMPQLLKLTKLSPAELLTAIESLGRRFFVEINTRSGDNRIYPQSSVERICEKSAMGLSSETGGFRNGFSMQNLCHPTKAFIETRFLGWLVKCDRASVQKPGFYAASHPPHQSFYRNPVSWCFLVGQRRSRFRFRNRV